MSQAGSLGNGGGGGGTVTSVSGTANRITSTGGSTPVIDIAATYVGQSSITTLGTVGTGTWNATAIGPTFGGTNQTTYATGDILYASGANTLSKLAASTNGFILKLAGGVPTWAADSTGTVTSVSGTTNRITSTGGATPVIDISASYVGQASITTLGTIGTGVWNGTAVVVQFGGTGRATLTNHGVLVGAGTTAITQLAAGTAGQVLQSGGASADPAYSTPTYPSASGTARKILVSDGTNNVYSTETWAVPGTSGNLLTSNGTNWTSAANSSFSQIVVQVISALGSGTYTPTAGMKYCIVEICGGGGGGGGVATTSAIQTAAGSGGGGGGYARTVFSAAAIGASQTVFIGSGGTAGSSSGGNGGNGGATSFGASFLMSVGGGLAGTGMVGQGDFLFTSGGTGSAGALTGTITTQGQQGSPGQAFYYATATKGVASGGSGGSSVLGGGGFGDARSTTGTSAGQAGTGYGGGGGGACAGISSGAGRAGGTGAPGVCIVTEFI